MSVVSTGAFANNTTPFFGPPPAFGSFSSSQTQAVNPAFPAVAALPLVFNTVDITPSGVSCAVPSSNIVIGVAGTYRILASLQCDKTTALSGDLEMWIAVNGTAIPNSGTRTQINQNQESVMTVEWMTPLNKNDAVSIVLASAAGGLQALAIAAAAPVPAIPSIIATVQRIA
jgi:hypothetical protein